MEEEMSDDRQTSHCNIKIIKLAILKYIINYTLYIVKYIINYTLYIVFRGALATSSPRPGDSKT
jgi:hypothetical protein